MTKYQNMKHDRTMSERDKAAAATQRLTLDRRRGIDEGGIHDEDINEGGFTMGILTKGDSRWEY